MNDSAAVTANTDTVGILTLFICVSRCTDKCKMSRDTARQLSLLADTYSLTCDVVVNDSAAVTANTDTVGILTDIAGSSQTAAAIDQVRTVHIQVINLGGSVV